MIGRIFLAIITIFLLSAFSGSIADGVHDWRTDDENDTFSQVETGAGVETANMTLAKDLFQDDPDEVVSITSNITGEYPLAQAYYPGGGDGGDLEVVDLNESEVRTLVVSYNAEPESEVMQGIGPFLLVFIIGGVLLAIGYSIWSHRRG